MQEYIEREAAKERLRMWITDCVLDGDNDAADCFRGCIDLLDSITTADVAPVRHGRWRWITYDANPKIGNWHCTYCNRIPKSFQKEAFCPNCGAKMDKEEP